MNIRLLKRLAISDTFTALVSLSTVWPLWAGTHPGGTAAAGTMAALGAVYGMLSYRGWTTYRRRSRARRLLRALVASRRLQ